MPRLRALLPFALAVGLAACHQRGRTAAPTSTTAPTTAPTEAAPVETAFDYHASELDNGMKVITLEDHSAPIAAVQLWYHVGSKDERSDRRGFAHMFEHMMFRGTQNIGPKAHFEYIRRSGGDANAYTSFDNTTYVQVVPKNQVEMVLWLEAERMGFLKINQDYYDTERKVVAEEYRMGREQPYGTLFDQILPQIFAAHPYAWTPIGNMDELGRAKADELQQFWNTYYVPNNATLVVVGDIEHDEVRAQAERYFGWIPRYDEPPRVRTKEPEQTAPKLIKLREPNGPVPLVGIAYRTVPVGSPDRLALDALARVLGGGESSRLYRRLVTDSRTAMFALASGFSLEDDGLFVAGAALSPLGAKPAVALKTIREEIVRLREQGPTEAEVAKARNLMLRDATAARLTVESKAQRLGEAAVLEGDVSRVNRELGEIRELDRETLQRVAKRYLADEREIAIQIEPNLLGFLAKQLGGDGPAAPSEPGAGGKEVIRGEGSGKPGLVRPANLPATPTVAPPLQVGARIETERKTLANGLEVVVLENHEVPFVQLTLGLRYGAFADPKDHPGVAYMTLPMLTRGTAKRDYKTLTDALDRDAISITGQADMDGAEVIATAVTDKAETAAAALAEVVLTPKFPAAELERLVDQTTTGLMVTERSPDYLADRELRRRIFGEHPYARLPEGRAADLNALDRDMLASWWDSHARPDAAVLYVGGDVTPEQAFAWAQQHFGAWKADGPAPSSTVPPPAPRERGVIVLVDKPGEQAQIRVGHLGVVRSDPRWPAARVLSEVFGGGFDSRLNDTIRVKRGLTYGASGGFGGGRFAGRFVIRTFSKNATVGETVQAILDEVDRLEREPPSDAERDTAVSYISGSYPRERETVGDLVGELWSAELAGLPDDWFDGYLADVRGADSKRLSNVARELVDRDRLVIVVVGSAKQLAPQLERLRKRFGPLEIVEP